MMNELWQRLVVRGLKNPKTWIFYPILIFGMLMIVQFNYNDSLPILDLDQLDKRTGTLIDVHTVGRAKEPWIVLKRGEETFRYYFSKRQLPEIKKHIGQEIVVWSQAQLNMGKFRFQNITRQVQVGGKLIQDYEKNIHPYLEEEKAKRGVNIFYIFPVIFIFWALIALWRMNAMPYEKMEKTKEKE